MINDIVHFTVLASGLVFNVALIAWFFVTLRKNGLIFSPCRGFAVLKPMMKCLLLGIIPGIILSNVLLFTMQNPSISMMLPVAVGSIISAWFIFKDLTKSPEKTS